MCALTCCMFNIKRQFNSSVVLFVGMPRHHPGPDMPNFYSLSPGGVGQITPPLGWWVTHRQEKDSRKHRVVLGLDVACSHHVQSDIVLVLCVLRRPAACSSGLHREVCLWLFLLCCCSFSHTAALCAQHMSNTSEQTCPCITIWLLNPHQSFLEALLSSIQPLCVFQRHFFSSLSLLFLCVFSQHATSSWLTLYFSHSVMFVKTLKSNAMCRISPFSLLLKVKHLRVWPLWCQTWTLCPYSSICWSVSFMWITLYIRCLGIAQTSWWKHKTTAWWSDCLNKHSKWSRIESRATQSSQRLESPKIFLWGISDTFSCFASPPVFLLWTGNEQFYKKHCLITKQSSSLFTMHTKQYLYFLKSTWRFMFSIGIDLFLCNALSGLSVKNFSPYLIKVCVVCCMPQVLSPHGARPPWPPSHRDPPPSYCQPTD